MDSFMKAENSFNGNVELITGFNTGVDDLGIYNITLFERAFNRGCDVVLKCSADFHLFPQIFNHVRSDKVVSFALLERSLADIPRAFLHLFYPKCWTGLYSLPRKVFEAVKDRWDGSDGDLHRLVRDDYVFCRRPMYYVLRPSKRLFDHRFRVLRKA